MLQPSQSTPQLQRPIGLSKKLVERDIKTWKRIQGIETNKMEKTTQAQEAKYYEILEKINQIQDYKAEIEEENQALREEREKLQQLTSKIKLPNKGNSSQASLMHLNKSELGVMTPTRVTADSHYQHNSLSGKKK